MFTIFIFFIILLVLVLSHEFGHFIVAKLSRMRVEEFGFGFPPRVWAKRVGETEYSFNLLPFGGFVRIPGEDGEISATRDPRNFSARPVWQRFLVIAAGVGMNALLAYILFTAGHVIGLPTVITEDTRGAATHAQVQILEVAEGSPAHNAGILPGDVIEGFARADGEQASAHSVAAVQEYIHAHRGEEVTLAVKRGEEHLELVVVPRLEVPNDEGPLGVALLETGIVATPWYRAPWEGLKTTYYVVIGTVRGLGYFFGNLFKGTVVGDVSGPIGIAQYAGEAGRLGFVYVLQLTALLSVNLAVLNIVPFPALDGGRILFLAIEKIKGSPVPSRVSHVVHAAGFALLILLMIVITYRDIIKIL